MPKPVQKLNKTPRVIMFLTADKAYGPFVDIQAARTWAANQGYFGHIWSLYPDIQGEGPSDGEKAHEGGHRL